MKQLKMVENLQSTGSNQSITEPKTTLLAEKYQLEPQCFKWEGTIYFFQSCPINTWKEYPEIHLKDI